MQNSPGLARRNGNSKQQRNTPFAHRIAALMICGLHMPSWYQCISKTPGHMLSTRERWHTHAEAHEQPSYTAPAQCQACPCCMYPFNASAASVLTSQQMLLSLPGRFSRALQPLLAANNPSGQPAESQVTKLLPSPFKPQPGDMLIWWARGRAPRPRCPWRTRRWCGPWRTCLTRPRR